MRPSVKNARKRDKRKHVAHATLLAGMVLDCTHDAKLRHVRALDPDMVGALLKSTLDAAVKAHRDP